MSPSWSFSSSRAVVGDSWPGSMYRSLGDRDQLERVDAIELSLSLGYGLSRGRWRTCRKLMEASNNNVGVREVVYEEDNLDC